ncbi:MAG: mechanosensitive ion channel, partial [Candidatus Diapherotrites archaeon]|nr:mechanosensitive ion channel [Candidatus Diapherotrites archaeon]
LYTYLVWGLVLILIIMSFFEDVGALLTSLGLIGFGITFALQKPILNFVGWLTIILTNPFTVGDRIEVSQIRGDVLSINTMYTRMQGTRATSQEKSEKIITLPNEFILTNPVINYSRLGDLFTDELAISITFESNWRKAMEILENVVLTTIANYRKDVPITKAEKKAWHEAIKLLQEASKKIKSGFVKESVKENIDMLKTTETKPSPEIPKPQFQLVLGESALNLSVIYQTDLRSVRQTKHEIVKGFLEEIEKWHDIEIAYPHMQIVTQGKTRGIKKTGKNILTFMEAENQQPI